MNLPVYVELPARDLAAMKTFYKAAFGWALTDFGPAYASTMTGGTDVGLQGDAAEATAAPLPVLKTDDLEATLAAVEEAGGVLVKAIFSFPGGRRFQFRDPSGNEIAVMVEATS